MRKKKYEDGGEVDVNKQTSGGGGPVATGATSLADPSVFNDVERERIRDSGTTKLVDDMNIAASDPNPDSVRPSPLTPQERDVLKTGGFKGGGPVEDLRATRRHYAKGGPVFRKGNK